MYINRVKQLIIIILNRQDEFILRGHRHADDPAPSDLSIEIRKRKRDICNIIHNSTWMIEMFILFSGFMCQLLTLRTDPYLLQCIHDTVGLVFARIIVPFTNLFAEQRIKIVVMKHGWIRAIKTALRFEHLTRVSPMPTQPIPMELRNDELPRNNQGPQVEIKSRLTPVQTLNLKNNHSRDPGKSSLPVNNNKESLGSSREWTSQNRIPYDLPNMVTEDFS